MAWTCAGKRRIAILCFFVFLISWAVGLHIITNDDDDHGTLCFMGNLNLINAIGGWAETARACASKGGMRDAARNRGILWGVPFIHLLCLLPEGEGAYVLNLCVCVCAAQWYYYISHKPVMR